MNVTWADTSRSRSHGNLHPYRRTVLIKNIATDPGCPMARELLKLGIASCIAIPLMADSTAFGALTIYAASRGFQRRGSAAADRVGQRPGLRRDDLATRRAGDGDGGPRERKSMSDSCWIPPPRRSAGSTYRAIAPGPIRPCPCSAMTAERDSSARTCTPWPTTRPDLTPLPEEECPSTSRAAQTVHSDRGVVAGG